MNIFGRIKNAVVGVLGGKLNRRKAAPDVRETRKNKLRFNPLKSHRVEIRHTSEPIRGPVFVPTAEFAHVSRQTCRARLRGLFFAQFSEKFPNASRRQRRRVSRIAAQHEYRVMKDNTNVVGSPYPALTAHA
jgi:hypothetical protein